MRPKVSIVIVNLNRAVLTLDCVQSIVAHTEPDLYEIIVADNGSVAAEAETLVQALMIAANTRFQIDIAE